MMLHFLSVSFFFFFLFWFFFSQLSEPLHKTLRQIAELLHEAVVPCVEAAAVVKAGRLAAQRAELMRGGREALGCV